MNNNVTTKQVGIAELSETREKAIVKTSIIGIVTNIFLAAFKAGVGVISGSIAIIRQN